MAQDIVSSMLNAQGIDPLDLVDDGPFETSSDSDRESADPSPSPSDEKPKNKTDLLKKLKSALGAGLRNMRDPGILDPRHFLFCQALFPNTPVSGSVIQSVPGKVRK